MSRIKGKYVANVIMTIDKERDTNMLPIEDIKDNAKRITANIKILLKREMDFGELEVTEQFCDFYEEGDEE